MWNLKNNTNECICKTETDPQTCGYQRGEGRGIQIRGMGLTDTNCYI